MGGARSGFPIGRLFGIGIFVDWSWLFIFALVTWNLGSSFLVLHPSWGLGLAWGLAVAGALLFFASVLAHELAHSLVAKARGVPVESITLFLFGGVSNIQREPPSPGDEFLITIVGPLTSIGLGLILYFLSQVTASGAGSFAGGGISAVTRRDALSTLLLWLGPVNVILGLFNLIPGFPLDGGRVLRALLWAITGRLRRATRWASRIGEAIGWLFIAAGIAILIGLRIPFLGNGFFSGLWAIFIGWFLASAAGQSYRQVVVHDVLRGIPVARLMRTDVTTTPPTDSINTLVHEHIMGTTERAFPVLDNGRMAGLICLDDVRRVPREDWDTVTVAQAMTPAERLTTVRPRDDAGLAVDELNRLDVNQLPVLEDGRLVGLVRRRDVLQWMHLHAQDAKG
jgi:Zn-dependent protease/predicted transcriptional regulator